MVMSTFTVPATLVGAAVPEVRTVLDAGGNPMVISRFEVPSTAPDGTSTPTSASGRSSITGETKLWSGLAGVILVVGIVLALAWLAEPNETYAAREPRELVGGLTIFAVFFVAAQAIERLLEPLSHLVGFVAKNDADEKAETAIAAVRAASDSSETAMKAAAEAKATLIVVRRAKAVFFWATATAIGACTSASLNLYLLSTVGIGDANQAVEIIATGLIIGAGTKPLHELIGYIESKKAAADAAKPS